MAAKTTAAAKKTAAAAKSAPKMVGTVDMSKVKRAVLVKYAVQLKVGTDADTDEKLVKVLTAKFEKLGVARLADCTNCGGESDRELDACPFCGDANEDEDADESSASASDEDDDQDAASGSDDDDASSDNSASDTASASIDDDPEEVAAANARAAAQPASILAGVAPKRVRKVKSTTPAPSAAMVPAGANATEIVDAPQHTEADFDEAVKRVKYLKGEPMVSLWRLGAEIKVIFDKQLWKQRNKEGGGAAYKSFNQCVIKELGFTVQNAYWLMDVSANFNEEQVREFGTSKLGTILAAPKESREHLLEMAKEGASVRQLRTAVTVEREKAGTDDVERETGRRKKPRKKGERAGGAKAKAKAKLKPMITVANIIGRQTVRLYKNLKPEARATKLGDLPTGFLDLENGVRMHFLVTTTPSGEVVLRVDTKREE